MAVVYNTKNIVTDKLILCLDAANGRSYPKSGTTFYDLSGKNNHCTLNNGPVYNSANKGNILLDGVDDNINTSSISRIGANNATQIVWYKWSGVNQANILFYFGSNGATNGVGLYIGTSSCTSSNYCGIFIGGSSCNATPVNQAFTLNTGWNMFTHIRDSYTSAFYVNDTYSYYSSFTPNQNDTTYNYFVLTPGGNIGMVMFYDKQLSGSELIQNYTATKKRYQ